MESCCNIHDICYDTCNKDKELCDIEFKRCLYNYCDTHEKSTIGTVVAKGCKAAAKMLFTGTMTLGCRSYLDSQERACYCAPQTSSSNQRDNGYNKKQKDKKYSKDKNYQDNYRQQKPTAPQSDPPPAGWRDDL